MNWVPYQLFTGMITPSVILCHVKNTKEFYYQYEDEPEPPTEAVSTGTVSSISTPVPAPIVAPVIDTAGPIASIPDTFITIAEVLNVIAAQKLKKPIEKIPQVKSCWWKTSSPEQNSR